MFDWHKAFKNKSTNGMTRMLTDTFTNIFKKFIPHKTKRFDCKYPEWMNSFIISSLKKRTKCTKRFYKNSTDYNKDLLNNQAKRMYEAYFPSKRKTYS